MRAPPLPLFPGRFSGFLVRAGLVFALAWPGVARGQEALPSFDGRTFRPSVDPRASLVLEPTGTQGAWQWNVGASLAYANMPFVLRGADGSAAYRPVRNQLGLDLVGGLGLGSRASLGLSLPTLLYQEGSDDLPPTVSTNRSVPTSALGDLGLHGKVAVRDNRDGGVGLASLAVLTLPTGSRESFAGEGAATVQARLLASYSFVVAELQGSVGFKARTERRTWPEGRVGGVTFGDEIPWSVSLGFQPSLLKIDQANRQRWEVSLHGSLPAGPVAPFSTGDTSSIPLSPVMLALSDRVELGHYRDVYLVGGIDLGLNSAVGVPAFRAIAQLGWAPRSHDEDHDGVPDDLDQCPQIPEDRDGFEDSDGCPEIDDDDDGVVDKEDACPRVPGLPGKDPRRNGCPAADKDRDGVPDDVDACPELRGLASDDPRRSGCPVLDGDGDGIADHLDRCPTQAEDRDDFEDEDGCPDIDDDHDGVLDAKDMCPRVPGIAKANASRSGCPFVDKDSDTYDDDDEKCPDAPETFNGVEDEDGCPDVGGKALVVVDARTPSLRLGAPIAFAGTPLTPEIDPASLPTIRAIAVELIKHPSWTLTVGVKPGRGDGALESATVRTSVIRDAIERQVRREGVVESASWDAVKGRPSADPQVGFLVLDHSAKGPAPLAPGGPKTPPKRPSTPTPKKS